MTDTHDDPIVPGPATPLERGAAAMETTPDQWAENTGAHKAAPAHPDDPEDEQPCAHCRRTVKRVPGGHGPTWVHADTGAVVGFAREDGPEKWVPEAIAEQEAYLAKRRAERADEA